MRVGIIIFDDFTDIDLFFMWDILARKKFNWDIKILGSQSEHRSSNGLSVKTHGRLQEASNMDVVLFSSGKGTRSAIHDEHFLHALQLNPQKQLIGSMCSGALILAKLGFLKNKSATTHLSAKAALAAMDVNVVDLPFVCHGNIATAGGCLSAQYLVAWIVERQYGSLKRKEVLREIAPVGQVGIYESLVTRSMAIDQIDKIIVKFKQFIKL